MHTDQQVPFRIGVTRDVRLPDGTFAFAPFDLSALEIDGLEWAFLAEDARPLTPELLAEIDGLYHFSAPVTADSLEGVDRLALLARHGVGLDFIDLEACTQRGIAVTITPHGVTGPMASAAVTLVLALAHRLRERDRALHDGDWGPGRFEPPGVGLEGRTLGVIGYGRIGREVVRLLRPWEMRVLVTQRTPVSEDGVSYVPLETLLAEADVAVVACPLNDATRGLLDGPRLALMKPTAFLVNVSRGAIVDQAALVEALRDGRLGGAGLDVVDPEPLPADAPLLRLANVVGAPHSLGYTDELLRGCVQGACRALLAVAAGRVPPDLANPGVLDNALFAEKLGRFAARAERRSAGDPS
ncbi:MAG TPA: NAD(P)-dependent oxidoreductase [Gaiellaceae bacterium]|jgi:phosphoglycerate dehydrogenase-like enzyme